jgi:flagellar biosynthesis protein FlhF
MQYFSEQGDTHREALEKVRAKYGDTAQVMSQRTIRMGGFLGLFSREGVELSGIVRQDVAKADSNRKLELEEEKRKLLAQIKNDQTLQQVLREVQTIKERIAQAPTAAPRAEEEHPAIGEIQELLYANEFDPKFAESLLARLRRDCTLEELDDRDALHERVLTWIGDSIEIAPSAGGSRKPRIIILVGPTGVGKTTSIAKMAAIHAVGLQGERQKSVRMITIDTYRIGARQQIETYGNIMGVPVSCVETPEDLRKTIAMYQDVDLILVDTIGKSPRDAVKLAEMKKILEAAGSGAEVMLAVSATTKAADIRDVMRQFEPFGYRSLVVTKVDETNRLGNVISALSGGGRSVAYLAVGQRVPQDIERASVMRMLMSLEGFTVNRPKLEERYSLAEAAYAARRSETR